MPYNKYKKYFNGRVKKPNTTASRHKLYEFEINDQEDHSTATLQNKNQIVADSINSLNSDNLVEELQVSN